MQDAPDVSAFDCYLRQKEFCQKDCERDLRLNKFDRKGFAG